MQKFNKMIAKKYTTKSGEDKTQWIKIGEMTVWDDGKSTDEMYFEKPLFAWDGKIHNFPKEQHNQGQPTSSQPQQNNQYNAPQNQQNAYQQQQQPPVHQENVPF